MIDQRLRARNGYLVEMDRRVEEARKARNTDWFSPATLAVSACLNAFLPSFNTKFEELSPEVLVGLAKSIELRLNDLQQYPVPAEVIDQVATALTNPHSTEAGQANYVFGAAIADQLGKSDGPESIIERVADFASRNDVRLYGFDDELSSYLVTPPLPLIDAFRVLASAIAARRAELVPSRFAPILAATEEAWSSVTDIIEVWRGRRWDHVHMYADELSVFHVLNGTQPIAFLEVCELLQIPPLAEWVLSSPPIAMDFDNIIELVAAAPTIEDQESGSWNRSIVAPILLDVAFRHLMELGKPPVEPLAEVQEVSSLAHLLSQTCLARPDGLFLIVNWTRYLIHLAGSNSDKYFDGVFSTIIDVMAWQGVNASAMDQLVDLQVDENTQTTADSDAREVETASPPTKGFDYFMISALINGSDACHSKVALRPMFQHHLCRQDSALADYVRDKLPNWRHYTVAKVYLQPTEVVGSWEEDWALLAPQRRAATHWSYGNNRDAAHPSLFLANVGVALIDWCTAAGDDLGEHTAKLWATLFESILPFATHWTLADDNWRRILQALFARYSAVFRGTESAADSERVWRYLDALGGDDVLLTIAVAHLLMNGVTLEFLTRRGGDDSGLVFRIQEFADLDASYGKRLLAPQILVVWNKAVKTLEKKSVRPR